MRISVFRPAVAVWTGGFLFVAFVWGFADGADRSGLHSLEAQEATPERDSEIAQLRRHIERLERRVEQLERQMATAAAKRILPLEAQVAPPATNPPRVLPFASPERTAPPEPVDPVPPHLPRGSRRGEINGTPFYFIPLGGRTESGTNAER